VRAPLKRPVGACLPRGVCWAQRSAVLSGEWHSWPTATCAHPPDPAVRRLISAAISRLKDLRRLRCAPQGLSGLGGCGWGVGLGAYPAQPLRGPLRPQDALRYPSSVKHTNSAASTTTRHLTPCGLAQLPPINPLARPGQCLASHNQSAFAPHLANAGVATCRRLYRAGVMRSRADRAGLAGQGQTAWRDPLRVAASFSGVAIGASRHTSVDLQSVPAARRLCSRKDK